MTYFDSVSSFIRSFGTRYGFGEDFINYLLTFEKVIAVTIPVSTGETVTTYRGWRSQHNSLLGPYKGGIRFAPTVDEETIKALSLEMTLKCAIAGLPYGGGKGGIAFDPKSCSPETLEHLSRQFIQLISDDIGANKDIPAPDINTNERIMAWMLDEYQKRVTGKKSNRKIKKNEIIATFTGKSLKKGGLPGREEATGYGGVVLLSSLLAKLGKDPATTTVAIQGFGNVGYWFAHFASKAGFQVVAVCDSRGGITIGSGSVNLEQLVSRKTNTGSVMDDQIGRVITPQELLELPVDVVVPAAIENAINEHNAASIKAKYVIEMANGGVTAEAQKILAHREIVVIPDIIANGAGVTGSYIEWDANLRNKKLKKEKTLGLLQARMQRAFSQIHSTVTKRNISYKDAAYLVALNKLYSAYCKQFNCKPREL